MGEWVGIDLDGTLAHYDGFKGEEVIGKPITKMMSFVKKLIEQGKTIKIFTARAGTAKGKKAVEHWCQQNELGDLEVTNVKDFKMERLYDDRAVQVETNTGRIIEGPEIPKR